jgi:hypothetical protein
VGGFGTRIDKASAETGAVFADIVQYVKLALETLELVILENVLALHEPPKQAKKKNNADGTDGVVDADAGPSQEKSAAQAQDVFTNLDFCVAKLLEAGLCSSVLLLDPRIFGIADVTTYAPTAERLLGATGFDYTPGRQVCCLGHAVDRVVCVYQAGSTELHSQCLCDASLFVSGFR